MDRFEKVVIGRDLLSFLRLFYWSSCTCSTAPADQFVAEMDHCVEYRQRWQTVGVGQTLVASRTTDYMYLCWMYMYVQEIKLHQLYNYD